MRKSSCWMILVALLTITAPTAFADSLTIVFMGGITTPVDNSISFTQTATGGVLDLGTVTDAGATFTFSSLLTTATPQSDTYVWQLLDPSHMVIGDLSPVPTSKILSTGSSGTFTCPQCPSGIDNGTFTVSLNTVAAPEPSPVVLTLVGLGLLVVMRKRKALGLAQAT